LRAETTLYDIPANPIYKNSISRFCNGGCSIKYNIGDEVQIDIPDPKDPDHMYHEEEGEIAEILEDDLSGLTGNPDDDLLYTVDFYDEELGDADFRYQDLRPL
jgi:hypothetical protein